MSPRTIAAGLLVAAALLSTLRADAGDDVVAQAAYDAGNEALKGKYYAAAREKFERALEEDPQLVEAWCGIGLAQAGEGKEDEALASLRKGLGLLEAVAPLEKSRLAMYEAALDKLGDLSSRDAELTKLMRKQADTLLGLGKKYASKDADAAAKALFQAIRLAPENTRVAKMIDDLKAEARGHSVSLMTGALKGMWSWIDPPEWSYEGGIISGDVKDAAMLVKSDRVWSGDYDVLVEARLVDTYPKAGAAFFAVMPAWVKDTPTAKFGVLSGKVHWQDQMNPDDKDSTDLLDMPVQDVEGGGIDPKEWNTYEVRLRGRDMSVYVNGKKLAEAKRPKERTGGHVVLLVQLCKAEFRRVEVTPR